MYVRANIDGACVPPPIGRDCALTRDLLVGFTDDWTVHDRRKSIIAVWQQWRKLRTSALDCRTIFLPIVCVVACKADDISRRGIAFHLEMTSWTACVTLASRGDDIDVI